MKHIPYYNKNNTVQHCMVLVKLHAAVITAHWLFYHQVGTIVADTVLPDHCSCKQYFLLKSSIMLME